MTRSLQRFGTTLQSQETKTFWRRTDAGYWVMHRGLLATIGRADFRYPLLSGAISRGETDLSQYVDGKTLHPDMTYAHGVGFSMCDISIPSAVMEGCVSSRGMAECLPLICKFVKNLQYRDELTSNALADLKIFRVFSEDGMILIGDGLVSDDCNKSESDVRYYRASSFLFKSDASIDRIISANSLSAIRRPLMKVLFPLCETVMDTNRLFLMLVVGSSGDDSFVRRAFNAVSSALLERVKNALMVFSAILKDVEFHDGRAQFLTSNSIVKSVILSESILMKALSEESTNLSKLSGAIDGLSFESPEALSAAIKVVKSRRFKYMDATSALFMIFSAASTATPYPVKWSGKCGDFTIRTPGNKVEIALWGIRLNNCITAAYDHKSRGHLIGIFKGEKIVAAARWDQETQKVLEYHGNTNCPPPKDLPREKLAEVLSLAPLYVAESS